MQLLKAFITVLEDRRSSLVSFICSIDSCIKLAR